MPTGEFDDDDGDNNPDIGKKIHFIMKRIRFYNKIVGFSGNPIQIRHDSESNDNGDDHENDRDIGIYDEISTYEFANRKEGNEESRDNNDKPLYECRDSLYFPIPIVVDIVIALLGFANREIVDDRDEEIEQRVDGTRDDCQTPRHNPSDELDDGEEKCGDARDYDRLFGRMGHNGKNRKATKIILWIFRKKTKRKMDSFCNFQKKAYHFRAKFIQYFFVFFRLQNFSTKLE